MQSLLFALHLLAAIIWIGGMFFAYWVLRPGMGVIKPPTPLLLWRACFQRFFPWVWTAVITLPLSGYLMAKTLYGSAASWPWHLHLMAGMASLMIMLFIYVYFIPYRHFVALVEEQRYELASGALAAIRQIIRINLSLGLGVVIVATLGRF